MYKLAVISGIALSLLVGLGQSPSNKRSYVAGRFAMVLDGSSDIDFLRSVDGGTAVGDVLVEAGQDGVLRKQITGVRYEDITMTLGAPLSRAFGEWVSAFVSNKSSRKSGAILAADFDYIERSRLEFKNALITEVGFPALDAASKEPCFMTVKLQPESTARIAGSGRKIEPKTQKKWLPANFRLTIDGLEEPTRRVTKVDAITIKQKVVEGGRPELDVGDLRVTFPESHAKAIYDWHEDFCIKGNNGSDKELAGNLQYLGPDLQEVLFTLKLQSIGIFKMAPERADAGSENLSRARAEMYCETAELTPGSSTPVQ
jgi:hypothetical protein